MTEVAGGDRLAGCQLAGGRVDRPAVRAALTVVVLTTVFWVTAWGVVFGLGAGWTPWIVPLIPLALCPSMGQYQV